MAKRLPYPYNYSIDYYRFSRHNNIQHSPSEVNMAKLNTYCGSYIDDDSGIGFDYDYSSSSDRNSSTMTLIEPSRVSQSNLIPFPISGVTGRKRLDITPLIKFASDGIIERIRPATMKNSQNGDYIICRTNRGTYIACRTPIVPAWVTQLVHDIEFQRQ